MEDEKCHSFSRQEFYRIQSYLEDQIDTLRNRFDEEPGYIHPAGEYENLLKKINSLLDNSDGRLFKVSEIS